MTQLKCIFVEHHWGITAEAYIVYQVDISGGTSGQIVLWKCGGNTRGLQ